MKKGESSKKATLQISLMSNFSTLILCIHEFFAHLIIFVCHVYHFQFIVLCLFHWNHDNHHHYNIRHCNIFQLYLTLTAGPGLSLGDLYSISSLKHRSSSSSNQRKMDKHVNILSFYYFHLNNYIIKQLYLKDQIISNPQTVF